MSKSRIIISRVIFCLYNCTLKDASIVKRRAIEIRDVSYWNDCLKLLGVMPEGRVHSRTGSLKSVEIQCNVIRLILFHLTLCSQLIYLGEISRL
jgi:hypothetical protein